ncbi:N-acetyltransferase [Anaerococcus tetradius]|uniref:GNAT family N-acetyltransferase n=1 Tax=Anaerococcus tetradius TaxID=33036 RepID=UPI0023F3A46C|nr:GNAT family N-acetyltransferase [Anaerococcus tetradius]
MVEIRSVDISENDIIKSVVDLHLKTFSGFFLSSMGYGFLKQMYTSYCNHDKSDLIIAEKQGKVIGFLSYSYDFSGLYKFMIKKRLFRFAWYSLGAFLRKPRVFFRILRAFLKPSETKREEKYVELSSIGVDSNFKSEGIGTLLVEELKYRVNFREYEYITLETDAMYNDEVIKFYKKNGFIIIKSYVTHENREMYEMRYSPILLKS